jgi:hypothetical protein
MIGIITICSSVIVLLALVMSVINHNICSDILNTIILQNKKKSDFELYYDNLELKAQRDVLQMDVKRLQNDYTIINNTNKIMSEELISLRNAYKKLQSKQFNYKSIKKLYDTEKYVGELIMNGSIIKIQDTLDIYSKNNDHECRLIEFIDDLGDSDDIKELIYFISGIKPIELKVGQRIRVIVNHYKSIHHDDDLYIIKTIEILNDLNKEDAKENNNEQ